MTAVTEPGAAVRAGSAAPAPVTDVGLVASLAAAVVVGGGLAGAAAAGATPLLVAVAVVQAVLAAGWILGTAAAGRRGAYVVAAMAAAGADVAVSLFPHGRLGALLIVLGLAVPVLFVQQLVRGAARVRVTQSLASQALLVLAEVALAALLQIRHEFAATAASDPRTVAATVSAAAAAIPAAALVVGYLLDMVVPTPRFDRRVPRGLPALAGSGILGAAVGYLLLRDTTGFGVGPGVFVGAALGLLAGLLAVAAAFLQYATPARGRLRRTGRAVIAAALPLCLLAPVSFLLLLAVRA
jgi:hypothetical protein